MRSFASLIVSSLVLASMQGVQAQSSSSKAIYTDALARERVLRLSMDEEKATPAPTALLEQVRALIDDYERMSRRFPASGYMDNALWQAALLAADSFWTWGEAEDKETALRMFSALGSRFPTSSLVAQSPSHVTRLKQARPQPSEPAARVSLPPSAPPSSVAGSIAALTAIRRDVLSDTVRITLELGREVSFRSDRLEGPPRVFIDLENTRAIDGIKDATIPFSDDVVRQVRVGRQPDTTTRVVMDLAGAGRHSLYALYNPYRVIIDFDRAPASPPVVPAVAADTKPAPVTEAVLTRNGNMRGPAAAAVPPPDTRPAAAAEPPPPPATPAVNRSGGFSLSRQLGLSVSRIVIDPGHGGHDPGAKTKSMTEADLVLDVALKLEQLLLKHGGFAVVMTRRDDSFVALEERTAIANREGADLFLSIHANASSNTSARGIETYFLNLTTNPAAEAVAARENAASGRGMGQLQDIVKAIALNNKIDESRDFASMIQGSLYTQVRKADKHVKNLGVKQAPFMVLLGATMPSVLAEISFITNRQEAALLKTDKHRKRIAEALYSGVVRYQQSLKNDRLASAQ
jgi:N-acetylmuramoyl-L-alanine amidase